MKACAGVGEAEPLGTGGKGGTGGEGAKGGRGAFGAGKLTAGIIDG